LGQPIDSIAVRPDLFHFFLIKCEDPFPLEQLVLAFAPDADPVPQHELTYPMPLDQITVGIDEPRLFLILPGEEA
jgi:hypothetical protein